MRPCAAVAHAIDFPPCQLMRLLLEHLLSLVRPVTYCLPCHKMPMYATDEGPKCVSMTCGAISVRPWSAGHKSVGPCLRDPFGKIPDVPPEGGAFIHSTCNSWHFESFVPETTELSR